MVPGIKHFGIREALYSTLLAGAALFGAGCSKDIFSPEIKADYSEAKADSVLKGEAIVEKYAQNADKPGIEALIQAEVQRQFPGQEFNFASATSLAAATDTSSYDNPYRDLNYRRGDVNKDGKPKVDVFDLLALLKALGHQPGYDSNADVDLNKKVDVFDLLGILKILSGRDPESDYTGPSVDAKARTGWTPVYTTLSPDSSATLYTRSAGDSLEFRINASDPNGVDSCSISIIGPNGEYATQDTLLKVLAEPGRYTTTVRTRDASPHRNETIKQYEVQIVENGINVLSSGKVAYNEDMSGTLDLKTLFEKIGNFDISYRAKGFTNVSVAVGSDGILTASNKTLDYNGTETGAVEIVSNGSVVGTIPLEVKVNAMDDIRGQNFDNDTKAPVKTRMKIDGNYFDSDASGYFDVQATPSSTHTLKSWQTDSQGNPSGYVRTVSVAGGDVSGFDVYSVSYPTTVTAQQFRDFMWEGNAQGTGPENRGIIKFWDEGIKYILMQKSPYGDYYNINPAQLDTVEAVIREKIFAPLGIDVPIEKKGLDYSLPANEDRKGAIYVFGSQNFGIGTEIEDDKIIYAVCGIANLADIAGIEQEGASGIFMPFEIQNSIPKEASGFHMNTTVNELQPADIKAYKTAQRFQGEQIDNVLGMPQ